MLIATLIAPLVGAAALLLVSREAKNALKYSALGVSLAAFVLGLITLLSFDHTNPNVQMLTNTLRSQASRNKKKNFMC
jgi:NADH:ubiquinone oxidoreductase subunit 4 (subunit M)